MPDRHHDASRYDAFVSYSRRDAREAVLLRSAVERFARPWFRPRTTRVFLDTAALPAGGSLRGAIEGALRSSGALVLVASAESARSPWVREEVAWWLANRGTADLIVAALEATGTRGSTEQPPLPRALADALADDEHLWVDLRWMRHAEADSADPRLDDAAAQVVAALRRVPKDEVVGEHIRRRKQTRRVVAGTLASLLVLLVSALGMAVVAADQRDTAQTERLAATSRQLVAQSQSLEEEQPDLARQLLVQAYRLSPTDQVLAALIRTPGLPQETVLASPLPVVAVSPTAPLLAAVEEGHVVLHWLTHGPPWEDGPPATGDAGLAFSPDGTLLAVSGGGELSLHEVSMTGTVRETGRAALPERATTLLAFGAEGVVVEGPDAVTFVDVSDPASPTVTASWPREDAGAGRPTVLPSGVVLAAAPPPSDVPVPVVVTPLADPLGEYVLGAVTALSPDGTHLATAAVDNVVTVWDMADPGAPRVRATLVGESLGITSLAFSRDGTTLAVGTGSGTVQLWDMADPVRPVLRERLPTRSASVSQLGFAADSSRLVAVTGDPASMSAGPAERHVVRYWAVQGAQRRVSTVAVAGGRTALPAWHPAGDLLVAGFPARIWDVGQGEPAVPLGLLPSFALGGGGAYAFGPDGEVTSGLPPVTWDVSDPADPVRTGSADQVDEPADLVVRSPDDRFLLTGLGALPVRLWAFGDAGPTAVGELEGSVTTTQGASFSADGAVLATVADDGGAIVWDLAGGEPRATGRVPGSDVRAVAVDRVTGLLLTGEADGTVGLWDLTGDPELVGRRAAHVGAVSGVAFDPTGELVATAGADGVRLWSHLRPGRIEPMGRLRAGSPHEAPALAFSPDGAYLAASSTGTTEVWDVDVETLLGTLCATSEPISAQQWADYLPELAYDPPCAEPG